MGSSGADAAQQFGDNGAGSKVSKFSCEWCWVWRGEQARCAGHVRCAGWHFSGSVVASSRSHFGEPLCLIAV